jgi:hypothetical protein
VSFPKKEEKILILMLARVIIRQLSSQ